MGKPHVGVKIRNKLLQFSYMYMFAFLIKHAVSFTLTLVRAHTSAHRGQAAFSVDQSHRVTEITHRQLIYPVRNIIGYRTPLLAQRHLAMQTSFSLFNRLKHGVAVISVFKHIFLRL